MKSFKAHIKWIISSDVLVLQNLHLQIEKIYHANL